MATSKQEKSIQWTETNKTKQSIGEKHGQILQINILKKIAYRKKWITVPMKDRA